MIKIGKYHQNLLSFYCVRKRQCHPLGFHGKHLWVAWQFPLIYSDHLIKYQVLVSSTYQIHLHSNYFSTLPLPPVCIKPPSSGPHCHNSFPYLLLAPFNHPQHSNQLILKYFSTCPNWCGSLDWAAACKLKGLRFDSRSGHMPGLWTRSPVGRLQRQPHMDVSLPLFLPAGSSL